MDIIGKLFVLLSLVLTQVAAIQFHLSPNQKKCLREEIHKNVTVIGEYELSHAPGQKTKLHVSIRSQKL